MGESRRSEVRREGDRESCESWESCDVCADSRGVTDARCKFRGNAMLQESGQIPCCDAPAIGRSAVTESMGDEAASGQGLQIQGAKPRAYRARCQGKDRPKGNRVGQGAQGRVGQDGQTEANGRHRTRCPAYAATRSQDCNATQHGRWWVGSIQPEAKEPVAKHPVIQMYIHTNRPNPSCFLLLPRRN